MSIKKLFLLAALATLAQGVAQAAEQAVYTYCEGSVSSTRDFVSDEVGWRSAAMMIPAGVAASYEGNQLSTIRVGINKKMNIDTIRVWVRHSLDGENLVEQAIGRNLAQAINDGWNDVVLSTPLDLSGDEPLYVGYDVKQRAASYGISQVSSPYSHACLVNRGDGWSEQRGAVSIEAVFTGNSIPELDLMTTARMVNRCLTVGKSLPLTLHVRNIGTGTVNYFYVRCQVEGSDEVLEQRVKQRISSGKSADIDLEFAPTVTEATANSQLTITVFDVNKKDDESPADNVTLLPLVIIDHEFQRIPLLEEFTTEQCVNCPPMAERIHNVLAKDEFHDKVLAACHHAGYYTDHLTTEADLAMERLYGGTTYAPALMLDRVSEGGVMFSVSSEAQLEGILDYRMATPAYISVDVMHDYKAGAEPAPAVVNVLVSMERIFNDVNAPKYVTVYLLEDDVPSINQSGGTTGYRHQHVVRAYNSTWGEPVAWDDMTATYRCQFTLDEAWNTANMQLVAFVSEYGDDNLAGYAIDNANFARLTTEFDFPSGITTMGADGRGAAQTCDLQGRQVNRRSPLGKGIYIMDGRKVMVR